MAKDILSEFKSLISKVLLVEHKHSRIFRVSGPDHVRYLHNRLTQNIKDLAVGQGAKSLVLTPNGKIQGQFIVLKEADSVVLLSDEIESNELADAVKQAVLQFKVADQLELKDLSGELIHFTLYGDKVHQVAAGLGFAPEGDQDFTHGRREVAGVGLTAIRTKSAITNSFEILAPRAASFPLKTAAAMGGISSAGEEFAEFMRIAAGTPRFSADLSEKVLAPECDTSQTVSFNKGCYPGQEVVEMATARGRPNRKFVQMTAEGKLAVGDELLIGDKTIGTITSAVCLAESNKSAALGFVKTDAAESPELTTRSGVVCKLTVPSQIREILIGEPLR